MKKKWTIEEEEKLKKYLKSKNIDDLMKMLNRSEFSIRKKVKHMGLKFFIHKNKYDDNYLKNKYNWKEIQMYYDNNNFWLDVIKKFNISDNILCKGSKKGLFNTRNKSETMKLSNKLNPRKLSEETKKKISKSRIKYLKENPDKVPYKLNHYSKGPSYPEKYFDSIFNSKFKYTKFLQCSLYHIDFAIEDKKIAIEVDGEQHYLDKKIVESDKRKNKYLKNEGWDLIRIRWSHYQKMNKKEKEEYISKLINYINNLITEKPTIEIIDNKNYCECGKKIYKTSKNCIKCSTLKQKRKVENRPTKEEILKMIKETSYVQVGKKYGVSDNAIRKWLK